MLSTVVLVVFNKKTSIVFKDNYNNFGQLFQRKIIYESFAFHSWPLHVASQTNIFFAYGVNVNARKLLKKGILKVEDYLFNPH